jgi:hypothetical protein
VTAKYGQHAPGAPALSIDVKSEQRRQTTTSAPMGGDMARGGGDAGAGTSAGGGTSAGDVAAAALNSQTQTVNVMLYKEQRIGEFVNSVIVPGLTYGWGPNGTNVSRSRIRRGQIVIWTTRARTLEVAGTNAVLPRGLPTARASSGGEGQECSFTIRRWLALAETGSWNWQLTAPLLDCAAVAASAFRRAGALRTASR